MQPLLPSGITHGDLLGSRDEELGRRLLRENLETLGRKEGFFGSSLEDSSGVLVLSARLGFLNPEIIERLLSETVFEKLDASARLVKELVYEDEL